MHGYAPHEYCQLLTESKEGDWLECENQLSFITEQGIGQVTTTTRGRTGLGLYRCDGAVEFVEAAVARILRQLHSYAPLHHLPLVSPAPGSLGPPSRRESW